MNAYQLKTRRTRLVRHLLLLLVSTAFMAGCSDPKAPNRRNFTDAINRAISDSLFVGLEEMPVEEFGGGHGGRRLAKLEHRFEPGDRYLKVHRQLFNDRKRELLVQDLVAKGIIIPWMEGYYIGKGPYDDPVDVYLFKSAQLKNARGTASGGAMFHWFYCGRPAVSRIVGWTEPAVSGGVTISSVTYRAKFIEVPEWSSSLRSYLDETLDGDKETIVVLTPEGWRMR